MLDKFGSLSFNKNMSLFFNRRYSMFIVLSGLRHRSEYSSICLLLLNIHLVRAHLGEHARDKEAFVT